MSLKKCFIYICLIGFFSFSTSIFAQGSVGIGTLTPTEKLDIAEGNVRIRDLFSSSGSATADRFVVTNADGVLKTVRATLPKFFYMPSIVFNVANSGTFTKDLHQLYLNQFSGPNLVGSAGAPTSIPNLPNPTDLHYYITYYDPAIFSGLSIDANGVLTYTVDASSTPTASSFMNIVFVIKE